MAGRQLQKYQARKQAHYKQLHHTNWDEGNFAKKIDTNTELLSVRRQVHDWQ